MNKYHRLTVNFTDHDGNPNKRDDIVAGNPQELANIARDWMNHGLIYTEEISGVVRIVPARFINHSSITATLLRPEEAKRMGVNLNQELKQ